MANLILPFTSVIYNSGVILKNRKLLRLLFLQSKFHLKNVSVVGHMIGVVYDSRVVLIRKWPILRRVVMYACKFFIILATDCFLATF